MRSVPPRPAPPLYSVHSQAKHHNVVIVQGQVYENGRKRTGGWGVILGSTTADVLYGWPLRLHQRTTLQHISATYFWIRCLMMMGIILIGPAMHSSRIDLRRRSNSTR